MEVISIGESMVSLVNQPSGYIRHADSFKPLVAGAETNTLIGLSRLGHSTTWLSALGEDELGELILHKIRAENIDTSHVERGSHPTGVFFKQISPDGSVDVTYYRENSAASQMSMDNIDMGLIHQAKLLYTTGITLSLNDSTKKMMFDIVRRLDDQTKVVFDPNIRLKMWPEEEARETLLEFIAYVDYLVIGIREVEILLGHMDLNQAIKTFKEMGCANIIIKLGKEGACYDMHEEYGKVDNPRQFDEIDPVGAGDAFAAGVISGILDDQSPVHTVRTACFLGGYITQFIGDYQGFPDRKTLSERMDSNEEEKVKR